MKLIGRIIATEKAPSTIDNFCFWTNTDLILNPFDVIKVEHIKSSKTYAVIEEISHITDSASFLSDFISSDFGDVNIEENTIRIGMNYVKASVIGNDKGIFIPVHSNSRVYLATKDEVSQALGLQNVKSPLVCGYLEMYNNCEEDKITLPVNIDSRFLIGPEGAHLNISGISGLAAKTSYAMFLMKSIQEKYINMIDNIVEEDVDDSVAFVVFNVKGKDLLAIDEPNTFDGDDKLKQKVYKQYKELELSTEPFKQVTYLYPHSTTKKNNSYVPKELFDKQKSQNKAFEYKFEYEKDKDNIDLMFSNIDDSNQTMSAIINQIVDGRNGFNNIRTWDSFLEKISNQSEAIGNSKTDRKDKDISVLSWRKFSRIINKSIRGNSALFSDIADSNQETRISDKIKKIKKNDIFVIDIAKLDSDMQSYVFGNTIRELYDYQLGDSDKNSTSPSRIIVFIDELNKFASSDTPKDSPILKQILDIAERGRSLGVILFAAEQFKSAIHNRVSGNCSTFAYGRTNAIELASSDYRYIPPVYKNMMTRLKQGEYIIQNPIFRSLLNIKFPEPIYKQFK